MPDLSDGPVVELLSSEELAEAVEATVASAGLTLGELRAQAESGVFVSERARLIWWVVSCLLD